MILPSKDYETQKAKKMKEDMEKLMDAMMPAMFEKMLPAMLNAVRENIIEDMEGETGEVQAVIALKFKQLLSEEGLVITKKEHPVLPR